MPILVNLYEFIYMQFPSNMGTVPTYQHGTTGFWPELKHLMFSKAREAQLQQRVWHVEALAEEAAARELSGRQAELEVVAHAMQQLEAKQQAICREQLAEAEVQHQMRCKELEERGL